MATEGDLPKQMTAARKTSVQAMNLLAAEITGTAAEIAILGNIDKVDKALPTVTGAVKSFIKTCVAKPLLKPIEWCMSYTKGIEGEENYVKRLSQTEDARATQVADTTYRYTAAAAACYAVMGVIQHGLNKATGVEMKKGSMAMLLAADAGIHLGSIMVMGSPAMMRNTQSAKSAISCVFKSFGVDDAKANDMANYGIAVQVPNYLTYAADVGILYAMNAKNGFSHGAHL